jgi:hypothetical protein
MREESERGGNGLAIDHKRPFGTGNDKVEGAAAVRLTIVRLMTKESLGCYFGFSTAC